MVKAAPEKKDKKEKKVKKEKKGKKRAASSSESRDESPIDFDKIKKNLAKKSKR